MEPVCRKECPGAQRFAGISHELRQRSRRRVLGCVCPGTPLALRKLSDGRCAAGCKQGAPRSGTLGDRSEGPWPDGPARTSAGSHTDGVPSASGGVRPPRVLFRRHARANSGAQCRSDGARCRSAGRGARPTGAQCRSDGGAVPVRRGRSAEVRGAVPDRPHRRCRAPLSFRSASATKSRRQSSAKREGLLVRTGSAEPRIYKARFLRSPRSAADCSRSAAPLRFRKMRRLRSTGSVQALSHFPKMRGAALAG
jgi:hypothetical protein